MKKEIRFLSTEIGILCTATLNLSKKEKEKVENNKNSIENAAKDLAVEVSIEDHVTVKLNIGMSPKLDELEKAQEAMKSIVNEFGKIIDNLPDINSAENAEEQSKRENIHAVSEDLFNRFREVYPEGGICMVMIDPESKCVLVSGNMEPIAAIAQLMKSTT